MKLHTINTGYFKLDGGAMFGVVPKSIWQHLNAADENNMCTWAMRCLLIEEGKQLILVDNGIGNKQSDNFFRHYYLSGSDTLEKSINKAGYGLHEITDVILTHLHFDHCGGSVVYNDDKSQLQLAFPNATYWSSKAHWDLAMKPNAREQASFLKENIMPIAESGHLQFCDEHQHISPAVSIMVSNGHTTGMIHPVVNYNGKTLVFAADMIPSSHHIPVPYVMGYDTQPLATMAEKEQFLLHAVAENYILFFEHDPTVECCTLIHTAKGVRKDNTFSLAEWV